MSSTFLLSVYELQNMRIGFLIYWFFT